MSVSCVSRTALQVAMALGAERLIRSVAVAPRDDGHGNVGAKRRDRHDLPETAPGEDLGDARTADECPVELASRDVQLTGQPGGTDAVIAVVEVDKRKTTFA